MPKYKKNQYSEGFSVCGLIIGGMFLYWGISEIARRGWIGLWWIGIIFLAIGGSIIFGNLFALYNRQNLKNLVLNDITMKKTTSVEEISRSTGISVKDVRHIIMDLKLEGKLFSHFDKETGQIRDVSQPAQKVSFPNPTPDPLPTPKSETGKDKKYCQFCGNVIKPGAKFCSMCGSEL